MKIKLKRNRTLKKRRKKQGKDTLVTFSFSWQETGGDNQAFEKGQDLHACPKLISKYDLHIELPYKKHVSRLTTTTHSCCYKRTVISLTKLQTLVSELMNNGF